MRATGSCNPGCEGEARALRAVGGAGCHIISLDGLNGTTPTTHLAIQVDTSSLATGRYP